MQRRGTRPRWFDLADGRSVAIETLPNGWEVWTWQIGGVTASGIALEDFRIFTPQEAQQRVCPETE
jgi:hypothetical protein